MRGATTIVSTLAQHGPVSIHAPHARGDNFAINASPPLPVSIHAPHARGDRGLSLCEDSGLCFNPRPSCEGRRLHLPQVLWFLWFQSTPLMRGATRFVTHDEGVMAVSIHAPHARGDRSRLRSIVTCCSFQSTPLMRGATTYTFTHDSAGEFQSTPLMRGATYQRRRAPRPQQFQSTPLMRGATARCCETLNITYPI